MPKKGLYLPDGSFLKFSPQALSTELATRRNAGLFVGEASGWLGLLPDPDPVLRKRGDDAVVLEELIADDQVTTAMLSRKNRVLNAPCYAFRPGTPDGETPTPEADLVYQRLVQDLERTNLRSIISGILDAPFYGLAALEIIWSGPGSWRHIVDIVPKPFHWFAFDPENRPVFRGAQGLFCVNSMLWPVPLPEGKFIIATHQATYDNPYGLRLLSRCLWPVAFKRGGLQFYAKFVERHGLPWVVAKAPKGAGREDKQAMARDLARMVQDCVAALPAGADVEFLMANGTQDLLHERFLSRQDKSISKVLMGQTLTVEMEGRNNSQAAAVTHEDVAEGLANADKAMVEDAFNELAWIYSRVNVGPDVFAPIFSYEEPEDLLARADLDKKLHEIGVDFTEEHFTDNYNLKKSEFTVRKQSMETSGEAPGEFPGKFPEASFASQQEKLASPLTIEAQKRLDEVIDSLLPDAIKANNKFIAELEQALQEAASLDELQLALVNHLSSRLAPGAMEDLLARSMTAVAGYGGFASGGQGGTFF